MKHIKRKIKESLLILTIFLIVFISFSKAGILFSVNGGDIITVSTTKKTFEPNMYVASVGSLETVKKEKQTTNITTAIINTTKPITTTKINTTASKVVPTTSWQGPILTKNKGVVQGPSGKETYYNLNMSGIVKLMRNLGFSEEEYPYWIREDGVKMLGNYVMVAANFNIRPRGSIILSSLGEAIVCDTGGFANTNPTQLDIAVSW